MGEFGTFGGRSRLCDGRNWNVVDEVSNMVYLDEKVGVDLQEMGNEL